MNEITTITEDWSEAEQKFAEVLTKTVKRKHKEKELEGFPVPLANIHFGTDDFKEAFHIIQGIDRFQDWEGTAQYMLPLIVGQR